MRKRSAFVVAFALTALSAAALPSPSLGEEQQQPASVAALPKYREECAACHVAYPPGMLPAESWRRILNDLDHHFGANASIDPATVKQIESWLTAHAARTGRAASVPPGDRITRSTWFKDEHDEVPASAWQRPAVRSASNCAACHTRADEGNFDERYIRIPR